MPETPDVKLQVTAEDQGVAAAIRKLGDELKNLKAQEHEAAEGGLELKDVFDGLLGALAVEKFIELGKEVANSTLKIALMSKSTGVATESLSVYIEAAADMGIESEKMTEGISHLSTVIVAFQSGNQKAAAAMALLGLTTKSFVGLNADQKVRLVTNALGNMKQGTEAAYAATKLLGGGGAELLPVLQTLANDGFDEARQEGEKFGILVSTEMAENILIARDALNSLAAKTEGTVLQFESGFIPALTDATNAITAFSSSGAEGMKGFGQIAGDALKSVIKFVTVLFGGIEKLSNTIVDTNQNIDKFLGDVVKVGVAQAGKNFIENQKADQKFINDLVDGQIARVTAELDGVSRIQEVALAKLKAAQNAAKKPAQTVNPEEIKGDLKGQAGEDAKRKAALTSLEHQQTAELSITQAMLKQKTAVEELGYEQGLTSLKTYFEARRTEIATASNEEIAILKTSAAAAVAEANRLNAEAKKNRAQAGKQDASSPIAQEFNAAASRQETEAIGLRSKAEDELSKAKLKGIDAETAAKRLDSEEDKAQIANDEKLIAFRRTLAGIQGDSLQVAKEEIAAEAERISLTLAQTGLSKAAIEAQIADYTRLKTASATADDQAKTIQEQLKGLGDERAAIEDQVKQGKIYQIQADEQIRQLEIDRLPVLQQLAAAELAAAKESKDEGRITAALDYQKAINAIVVDTDKAGKEMATLKAGLEGTVRSGLEGLFTLSINGAQNMGQAFKALGDSVVSNLQRIVSQMLVNMLMQKLFDTATNKTANSNPATEVAAAAAKGAAEALPLTTAATALGVAGTTIMGAGTALTTVSIPLLTAGTTILSASAALTISAAALQIAADTLLIANSASGHAQGGLITGPGTETSDSIPARLSHGEYVVRAAAVRSIGVDSLDAMNRGLRIAPVGIVRGYAEGGLVGKAASGGPDKIHMQVGLEEGLVLKHLESKKGSKIVLSHLANNPKAAGTALGRSK